MDITLNGRVALVTGSSRGIGFEIARTLGLCGAQVAICSRNRPELIAAKAALIGLGIDCISIVADLQKAGSELRTIDRVLKEWGRLDILVNNVGGIPQTGKFEDLADSDWIDVFQLNLMTTVRFCRAAIPHLLKSEQPRIVNLSSMVAAQPGTFNPHYSAVKAGVINLTKHLAGVYAEQGVLVNCISPGMIHTEGWDQYIEGKATATGVPLAKCRAVENRRAVKNIPVKRMGLPTEVASLVAFLVSGHAAFITGTNHRVDGGRVQAAF